MSAQFDFISGILSMLKAVLGCDWIGGPSGQPEFPEFDGSPDTVPDCFQENQGSLIISHFADGTIRRENLHSGVIQEQHADGGLTVSLPDGKIFQQHFDGAPLLVLDLENPGPALLGRIMNARIEEAPSLVYHYEDPQAGHYVVEISTLRHFLGRRPPVAVAGAGPAGADWAWA